MNNRDRNNNIIRRSASGVIRRANSLGQFDEEFDYGPKPLDITDVPIDVRERYIRAGFGGGGGGISSRSGVTSDIIPSGEYPGSAYGGGYGGGLVPDILVRDVHTIAGTVQLRRGLVGRVVSVTSTPTLVVNQMESEGRGYLFLNPAGVVGLTAKGTLLSPTSIVGPNVFLTDVLGVANYKTVRLFFNIEFNSGTDPVIVDIQTLDPVTDTTWFTSQTEVFNVTETRYVNIGELGVDTDLRVSITVPAADAITASIGFVLKDGLEGTSAGTVQTIFLGSSGVSSAAGYPLLAGKERAFYLAENVLLYAVTAGPTLSLNVFEL